MSKEYIHDFGPATPPLATHERRLLGRVALITGASRGIGRAIALRLAADGAAVAVNYLHDEPEAEAVVEAIKAQGTRAIALAGDIGEVETPDRLTRAVVDAFGRVDILINNAAVFPWTNWLEIPVEEWDRVMAVDLRSCFLLARECYRDMRLRGWGRIVSLASATALTGNANLMHYATAKAGIVGLTRSLAIAVGREGITVNAVTTGKTLTDGLRSWFTDGTLDYKATIASRTSQAIPRIGQPEDLVGTVSFLVSDDAAFMTGQLLNVDGGRVML